MEALFRIVPAGTKVRVIDQPYKTGWRHGVLYLEAHAPALVQAGEPTPAEGRFVEQVLKDAVASHPTYEIDWDSVDLLNLQPRGVAVPIPPRAAARA